MPKHIPETFGSVLTTRSTVGGDQHTFAETSRFPFASFRDHRRYLSTKHEPTHCSVQLSEFTEKKPMRVSEKTKREIMKVEDQD